MHKETLTQNGNNRICDGHKPDTDGCREVKRVRRYYAPSRNLEKPLKLKADGILTEYLE